MFHDWTSTPDFINEEGTKWWVDKSTTDFASKPDQFGTVLPSVCFYVETADGYRSRVLVSKETNEIIAEDQVLESLACKIDVLKLLKREEESGKNEPKSRKFVRGTGNRKKHDSSGTVR